MIYNKDIEFVGGLVGDGLNSISKAITDGFVNGIIIILGYLLVVIYWCCKNGIIVCFLSYICSKDNKSISTGVKLAFIYLISVIIGGAI